MRFLRKSQIKITVRSLRFMGFISALFLVFASGHADEAVDAPRVYDCFPFYNELDRLHVRLAELYDVVDKFVIVEARTTHQGQKKELFFKKFKKNYAKYADKIIYAAVNLPGKRADHWARERSQRDQIMRVLRKKGLRDHDILIISDADEITRASSISTIKKILIDEKAPLVFLHQDMYIYYFNGFCPAFNLTVRALASTWGYLRGKSPTAIRFSDPAQSQFPHIPKSGWHFTWVGPAKRMSEKMQGVVEGAAENSQGLAGESRMEQWRQSMEFGPDRLKVIAVDIDDSFPKYIRDNKQHFEEYGLIAPVKPKN